jgi:Fe-S cluster assembly scaffold protein SufB
MIFNKKKEVNKVEKLSADFIKTAKMCGMTELLKSKGKFYVEENKVLAHSFPKGIRASYLESEIGVKAQIVVKKNQKIKEPLFFCFGLKGAKSNQEIYPEIILEENSEVTIHSHCSFPNSKDNHHNMEGFFKIGKNAKFTYIEQHYHGEKSGATVTPKLKIEVGEGGQFYSDFNLTKGTVGKVEIILEAVLKKNARAEIRTKVFGTNQKDEVRITDIVHLVGENSKSLVTMRAAAKNGGRVWMQGETFAKASGAFGHIDCQEIVIGKNSVAKAVPIVEVTNDQARVTHEASVGKINQKELETLMTRGLNEDQATELIIEALMK